MKVKIKYVHNQSEFVIEANPRLRDLESTTKKMVRVTVDAILKLGLARSSEE